jgi:hypothetical protein
MHEEWVTLLDFPLYKISNYGNVINKKTGKEVLKSKTRQNIVKISLVNSSGRHTRSVALLVAHIFNPGYNDLFDTLIHLDGNLENCESTNLVWRPRWFAYQYHRQFTYNASSCIYGVGLTGPIIEPITNTLYANVNEAAIANGLLIKELAFKAGVNDMYDKKMWPTGQMFEYC